MPVIMSSSAFPGASFEGGWGDAPYKEKEKRKKRKKKKKKREKNKKKKKKRKKGTMDNVKLLHAVFSNFSIGIEK